MAEKLLVSGLSSISCRAHLQAETAVATVTGVSTLTTKSAKKGRLLTEKKIYAKPTIERLGSIAELTQNGQTNPGTDPSFGSSMGMGEPGN